MNVPRRVVGGLSSHGKKSDATLMDVPANNDDLGEFTKVEVSDCSEDDSKCTLARGHNVTISINFKASKYYPHSQGSFLKHLKAWIIRLGHSLVIGRFLV